MYAAAETPPSASTPAAASQHSAIPGSVSFSRVSKRFVTRAHRANAGGVNPHDRAIFQFATVPAAPPKGKRLATKLPERFSRSARRWLRPGSAAVKAGVWTHSPASQTAAKSVSWPRVRPRTAAKI
jgi:hypothetical protein